MPKQANPQPPKKPETQLPSSAALEFVLAKTADEPMRDEQGEEPTVTIERKNAVNGNQPKPKLTPKTEPTKTSSNDRTLVPFSTRIRRDYKQRLKRLSHSREEAEAEVCTVQQFVEEAIADWLKKQPDRKSAR